MKGVRRQRKRLSEIQLTVRGVVLESRLRKRDVGSAVAKKWT